MRQYAQPAVHTKSPTTRFFCNAWCCRN